MNKDNKHIDTRLGHLGLDPISNYGIPNPPIYRTSTILSSTFAQHRGELPKPYMSRVLLPICELILPHCQMKEWHQRANKLRMNLFAR